MGWGSKEERSILGGDVGEEECTEREEEYK